MSARGEGDEHGDHAVNLTEVPVDTPADGSDQIVPISSNLAQHEPMQNDSGAENAPSVKLPIRPRHALADGSEQIEPTGSDLGQLEHTQNDSGAPAVDLPIRSRHALADGFEDIEPSGSDLEQNDLMQVDNGVVDTLEVDLSNSTRDPTPPMRRWGSYSDLGDIPQPLEESYFPDRELSEEGEVPEFSDEELPDEVPETSAPMSLQEWRDAGRPECPDCGATHAPPCDPRLVGPARTADERRRHRNWLKRQRMRNGGGNTDRAPNASATVQRRRQTGGGNANRAPRARPAMHASTPVRTVSPTVVLPIEQQQSVRIAVSTLDYPLEGIQKMKAGLQHVPGMVAFLTQLEGQIQSNRVPNSGNRTIGQSPTSTEGDRPVPSNPVGVEREQTSPTPNAANAERDTHAAPQGADIPQPASTSTPLDPLVNFRTGSERALARSLESGHDLSATAKGKQARK